MALFLADWKATIEIGAPVTPIKWERTLRGVSSKNVVSLVLSRLPNVKVTERGFIHDCPIAPAFISLTEEHMAILDYVSYHVLTKNPKAFAELVGLCYPIWATRPNEEMDLSQLLPEYQEWYYKEEK